MSLQFVARNKIGRVVKSAEKTCLVIIYVRICVMKLARLARRPALKNAHVDRIQKKLIALKKPGAVR